MTASDHSAPIDLASHAAPLPRAPLARFLHHEYWPTWLFYAPFWPFFFACALRHGGFRLVTCCNPDIENGGGWADESKHGIMARLASAGPAVLPTYLIPRHPDPSHRAAIVRDLMAREPELRAFPLVLKPDRGQRGHGFKVVRQHDDLVPYFASMTNDAVLQPYHDGPHECGILWLRRSRLAPPHPTRAGFIYSITRKEFPVVVGDGVRSLERLVLDHPRYRNQAPVFLARLAGHRARVPVPGERVRLAISGNHAQGTLFRDGADLLTDALEDEIDRIARVFPRLDVGRFDIRYESDALLRRGKALAVVELNGTSAEPTSMYDPGRSLLFAYRTLFGMWRHVFVLGQQRHREGVRALTVREFLSLVRKHFAEQTGSSIAD